MKIFIGNQGQFGDIVINTVLFRMIKILYPDSEVIANINKKYAEIVPILLNNKYIDAFRIWNGYDNWPNARDQNFISSLEDGYRIFHPMPRHSSNNWFIKYHQCQEVCVMNGFSDMSYLTGDYSCYLNKWFDIDSSPQFIAFAPFGGWYNQNNDKKLSVSKAQKIVDNIVKCGYSVLQLGGQDEPKLNNVDKHDYSILDSVKAMLGCKLLLHTDTFLGWVASAYSHPQIGLYSNRYYTQKYIKNIQPINNNAIYLDEENVNKIEEEKIIESLKYYV